MPCCFDFDFFSSLKKNQARIRFKLVVGLGLELTPGVIDWRLKGKSEMSSSVSLSSYRDQHFRGSRTEQERLLKTSTTLYVGNMSFYTTEEQLYELFSKCGDLKRIIMGLDKFKRTPCGFCFVEYYTREDAANALRYVNGTRLDDRIIRTDWDAGFVEGRQLGRGKTGGQVRDEYRTDYDAGRGGYGQIMKQKLEMPDFIK